MTALMLAMVTSVSLLVAVFAAGYMHGDPGYPRFFAGLSLFVFSMCMLVLAGNFLLLFVFWEGVGLCSYLLIGFWYPQAERGGGGEEGVCRQPHRRLRFSARHLPDLDDVRLARLRRRAGSIRSSWRSRGGTAGADHADLPAAVPGRDGQDRPSSRCTCGCRTRWKARRR